MDLLLGEDEVGDIFQEIEKALKQHQNEIGILYKGDHNKRTNFNQGKVKASYLNDFSEFPLDTITAQKEVAVYRTFYERDIWRLAFFNDRHRKDIEESILTIDEYIAQHRNDAHFIWCKLSEKFQSVKGGYPQCLKRAATKLGFFEDVKEEILLTNLLNHYQNILDKPDIQLKVFDGVIVTKEIADLYTLGWIAYFKSRLELISPVLSQKTETAKFEKLTRVVWTGSQKELAELFIELENKGWIESIGYGERAKIAKAILQLFDISKTKRSNSTNELKSFAQIYKGEPDANDKASKSFPAIYTHRYKKKFSQIISKR